MKKSGYPAYLEHKQKHEKFYDQIAVFKEELSKNNTAIYDEIAEFLKTWLFEHIMENDKKYVPCLTKSGLV